MGKELKRMHYFDGLFLDKDDYTLDQEYQRRLQRLHNRYLHTWGIVTGLEVRYKEGSLMTVEITEGLALDQGVAEDPETHTIEDVSREIVVYGSQPDNPLDLSKNPDDTTKSSGYVGGDYVYVYVSYDEVKADVDNIKGKGQEIHILERGRIRHSKEKPAYPNKDIILARVLVRGNETAQYIDSGCISYTDADGSQLRTFAGPAGNVLALEKLILRLGEGNVGPYIRALDQGADGVGLEINSNATSFTGAIDIKGDLYINGKLNIMDPTGGGKQSEMLISNSYVQVNSPDPKNPGTWKLQDGGLEVYRGGTSDKPDARIIWSEAEKQWKVGEGDKLNNLAYGPLWERLIRNEFNDDLHRHGQLCSAKGVALSVDSASGNLTVNGDLAMKDRTLWLRSVGDANHGLGWFGIGKPFAGVAVDGPALFGYSGGILGTTSGGQKSVLSWNNLGNVGVGTQNPKDDRLDVAGNMRILSTSNPVRFTSVWTGFPDNALNQAEICNDTTYHKALMIVGNKSAGLGRRVAIWDRLDVNGFLYVNGSMQMSQALTPSAGWGDHGIVFPSNPGGGGGDIAYMQYYPRAGESCTLEIGINNDGDDHISFMPSGNLGIGTRTPADKLDVGGWTRIMTGSNPIRFTSQWTGFPDWGYNNQAEICNDTTYYKTLMIVGNRSNDPKVRRVSVWDRLDVNGLLYVNGEFQTNGPIVPSVGSGESNGIMFPKNPGGGSGDAAWIRYYSDTARGGGENMTLEIGIANDPLGHLCWNGGDRIRLYAAGGVYVDGYFYVSSSREYKENINSLATQKAKQVIDGLNPVTFNFKGDKDKLVMGFIAEDVPQEVAAYDQKAISPVEIIAALTSVVKDQRKTITKLQKQIEALPGAGK